MSRRTGWPAEPGRDADAQQHCAYRCCGRAV